MTKIIKFHFDKIVTQAYDDVTQYELHNCKKQLINYDYSILYENIDVYLSIASHTTQLLVNFPWAHIYPNNSYSKYLCCLGEETSNVLRQTYNKSPDLIEQVIHDYFLTMTVTHAKRMGLPFGQTHQDDIKLCAFLGKPYHITSLVQTSSGEFIHNKYNDLKDDFKLCKKCIYCGSINLSYKLKCTNCLHSSFRRYRGYY